MLLPALSPCHGRWVDLRADLPQLHDELERLTIEQEQRMQELNDRNSDDKAALQQEVLTL